jgi:ribonuclease PH
VALALGLKRLEARGALSSSPLRRQVAAVSVGLVDGVPLLDLDYSEDSRAEVDLNVVMDDQDQLLEIQGTAEGAPFSRQQLNQLLDLSEAGLQSLRRSQLLALEQAPN